MSKNKKEFKAVAVGCLAPKSVFTYGGVGGGSPAYRRRCSMPCRKSAF